MNYSTRLVITFTDTTIMPTVVETIKKNFTVENNKLYVYKDLSQLDKLLLTYNILVPEGATKETFQLNKKVRYTTYIHRRRDTNTIYTINGLNEAIKFLNDGVLDKQYVIDWKVFENKLLLEKNNELNAVPIEFCRMYDLSKTQK